MTDGAEGLRPVGLVGEVWLRFGGVDGAPVLVGVSLTRASVGGVAVSPAFGELVVLVPVHDGCDPRAGAMLAGSVDVDDVARLVSRAFGVEGVTINAVSGSSGLGLCHPSASRRSVEVRVSWAEVVDGPRDIPDTFRTIEPAMPTGAVRKVEKPS